MSTVRFLSWSGLGKHRWPSGFNAPNAVFCGRFSGPINSKIKEYPFAAFSTRFPGVSINVAAAAGKRQYYGHIQPVPNDSTVALDIDPAGAETATPEIYMSGKFIIPGTFNGLCFGGHLLMYTLSQALNPRRHSTSVSRSLLTYGDFL